MLYPEPQYNLLEDCLTVVQLQNIKKKNLRGFGPLANYADRATAASWPSSTNCCG
jgi:hypothetical protein